MANAGANTNGS